MRVIEYHKYFDIILACGKPNFNEVFLKEFIDDYISSITHYEVWGAEPKRSEEILSQLKNLADLNIASDNISILKTEIERIDAQLKKLDSILNGETYGNAAANKAAFPLIYSSAAEGFYGILESVTIHIRKAEVSDKFIIVPSEKETEKKILEQCKRSWFVSLDLSREYIKKPYWHHEVIISFNKKDGFYEGNSLGTALTISFLEELLKFYNPTYIIKIKEQTAFTGGMTETGKVLACGEEIIKQKVKAVFFSEMNAFVLPKCEEAAAQIQLTELKKNLSDRKLKLISVEDINDVLNRRDVIDIRKQKLVVRIGKFVKKNWVSAVITVLLAILFGYLFVMDWDDNPALVSINGQFLHIENKKGRVLWTKRLGIDLERIENKSLAKMLYRFENINEDEYKELILCFEFFDQVVDTFNPGRIVCYDYKGKQLWQYVFQDSIYSKGEFQPLFFSTYLIDLRAEGNTKTLYAIAANSNFASAVFKLDAKNGLRLGGTLWNAGHFQDGIIGDFNNDGESEIVLTAIDNGFERSELISIDLKDLAGQLPTTQNYLIHRVEEVNYNRLVLLPITDFAKYLGARFNIVMRGGLRFLNNEFSLTTAEDITGNSLANINYRFDVNLNCVDIECGDYFQVKRDSLVVHNKLQNPFTNTREYELKLKSEIIYK